MQRFNGPDKALKFTIAPSLPVWIIYIPKTLSFLHSNEPCKAQKRPWKNLSSSAGLCYLIPQTLCRGSPRSLWSFADSPPWLGCPCRDSCTQGTLGRSCTSSRYPCSGIHPPHCKRCSWEQPARNLLSGSLAGSAASLQSQDALVCHQYERRHAAVWSRGGRFYF